MVEEPALLEPGRELLGAVDDLELPEPGEVTFFVLELPGAELLLLLDPQIQLLQPPLDLDELEVGTGVVPLWPACEEGDVPDTVDEPELEVPWPLLPDAWLELPGP